MDCIPTIPFIQSRAARSSGGVAASAPNFGIFVGGNAALPLTVHNAFSTFTPPPANELLSQLAKESRFHKTVGAACLKFIADGGGDDGKYRVWANRLAGLVESCRTGTRFALYPAGGSDIGTLMTVFPLASSYIFLDSTPFLKKDGEAWPDSIEYHANAATAPGQASPAAEFGSPVEMEVDLKKKVGLKGIAHSLLGRLKWFNPSAEVLDLSYFVGDEACHGAVSVFVPEVGSVQHIIYIHCKLNEIAGGRILGASGDFDISFADGMLIKGANALFVRADYHFGRRLFDVIAANKGIVVEGFSSEDFGAASLPESRLYGLPPNDYVVYPDFRLSYTDGMRVTKFR